MNREVVLCFPRLEDVLEVVLHSASIDQFDNGTVDRAAPQTQVLFFLCSLNSLVKHIDIIVPFALLKLPKSYRLRR